MRGKCFMYGMRKKKIMAVLLVFILAVTSLFSGNERIAAAASAKVTLSKNKLSITAGKKKTVRIKKKNVKKIKSVKWKTNKKKVLTVSDNKSKATITAKKPGKAQVTCTVKYFPKGKKSTVKKQKIIPKVTVTERKKPSVTQGPSMTSEPSATPEPSPGATQEPDTTPSPVASPTITLPSVTALPTETPSPDVPGDDSGSSSVSGEGQPYSVPDKILNNGYKMPALGIGTYALTVDEAENSVYHALKDDYRLVDTTSAYYNEEGVGRGIKRAIDEGLVKREDIFVTTKVWDTDFGNARASWINH